MPRRNRPVKRVVAPDPVYQSEAIAKFVLGVKPRRVGGATYQVPVEIRPERRLALARRWLVRFARQRGGKSMSEKLAFEILDAAQNTGGAVKRKEETHRMAESNKAFSH